MMDDDDSRPNAPHDAGAASVALGAASPAKADAWLEAQTHLARLQAEDLQRENKLRHWSLQVRHTSDVLKLSFELALALIFTAIVVVIGAAFWSAASDKGLVIESFSVPPDMEAKGLTGDVIASKLLDRLAAMQNQTVSHRAASSYANNWGKDIKVQIPDTGVSIGELDNYLHQWLGEQTRISGEIYRTHTGIAVTARAGGETSPTFTGDEADLDALIQKAAEAVYRSTQPYRYAIYLQGHNRNDEASAILDDLVRTGSSEDRTWAYIGLSGTLQDKGDFRGAIATTQRAIAAAPGNFVTYANLASYESNLQHDEQSLAAIRQAVSLAGKDASGDVDRSFVALTLLQDKATLALTTGDNQAALEFNRQIDAMPDRGNSWNGASNGDMQACGGMHDIACVRRVYATFPATKSFLTMLNHQGNLQGSYYLAGQWRAVLDLAPDIVAALAKMGDTGRIFLVLDENPFLARAHAELGDLKTAHALIDTTPADCVVCLRVRGRIAALEKRWNAADYWYARATALAPSVPSGWTEWGQALLLKGDAAGAIDKFKTANAKGPRFADPLEGWGEALMAKNHSDQAIIKFAEAEKYSPNWGRLHLKWGEALVYAGKKDEAKVQFVRAGQLDLTATDKAELARQSPHA